MRDEATALKPCPFCGGEVEYSPARVIGDSDMICHKGASCGLDEFSAFNIEEDVRIAWNRRAVNTHDAALSALREARGWIDTLPEEAFGFVTSADGQARWPVRNELLARIDALLAPDGQTNKEG